MRDVLCVGVRPVSANVGSSVSSVTYANRRYMIGVQALIACYLAA
jgi:hypothetical protein